MPERNALHLIRDVLSDPTARSILGHLSTDDLNALAKEFTKAGADKVHPDVKAILEDKNPSARARRSEGRVAQVIGKLRPSQAKALSTLYNARGPECR